MSNKLIYNIPVSKLLFILIIKTVWVNSSCVLFYPDRYVK